MTRPTPLLQVRGLRVAFGNGNAPAFGVDDMSFSVDPGETVAIVGESGSGKSVTALSIMRLVEFGGGRIVAGEILLTRRDGTAIDLARASRKEMCAIRGNEIAMIFQEPMTSLNPIYTVGEQIAETLRRHRGLAQRTARRQAGELLERVRIPEPSRRLRQYPHELSGGMRQRVMIAIALACEPRLLIADEPTTALDVTIQAQILDLMRELKKDTGAAMVFITHDMAVVAEIADRVAVMYDGQKVEETSVYEIYASPVQPYTRALLAAVPRLGELSDTDAPRRFSADRSEARPKTHAPADPPGPLLEVRELVTRFPLGRGFLTRKPAEIHAVELASFVIGRGETLGLVGESGSGKSTVARSVLRLVEPRSGHVSLEGKDVLAMDPEELRRARADMQIVFQDPYAAMNPRRRAFDQVADPLRIHGRAGERELEERVVGLVERVGLSRMHLDRYPHEFSGGQRQRLCIARALSLSPKLLVADEPVSALDVSVQAQVVDLFIELQESLGLSFLFISHDIAVVERLAHRVAVMHLGRIVEIGPRQRIFESPQHPYTQRLLNAVPMADPTRVRDQRTPIALPSAKSSVYPMGQPPLSVRYDEVSSGHLVAVA